MNLAKLYILCDTHEENGITKGTAFSFIALTNVAKHNHQFQNRSRFIEECERRWQYSEGLMEKYK